MATETKRGYYECSYQEAIAIFNRGWKTAAEEYGYHEGRVCFSSEPHNGVCWCDDCSILLQLDVPHETHRKHCGMFPAAELDNLAKPKVYRHEMDDRGYSRQGMRRAAQMDTPSAPLMRDLIALFDEIGWTTVIQRAHMSEAEKLI